MNRSRIRVTVGIGVAAFLAMLAPAARAQAGHTTLLVGAGDGTTGLFLRDVQVRISSLNLAQYTDSMGQARFTRVAAGTYTIEARRIGYQLLSAPILIRAEDTLEVVMMMRAVPAQLDTVVVSRSAISMHLREFETRRERGLGQFVTAAQIDAVPGATLTNILEAHVRGVTAVRDNGNGVHVMSYRQATEHALDFRFAGVGSCWPVVYLDGVQLADDTGQGADLRLINISSVGGIEFYTSSQIPVQYQASGVIAHGNGNGRGATGESPRTPGSTSPSCGVMLIWTRP